MHKTRSSRRANQRRRERQARRQSPLPLAAQTARAAKYAAQREEDRRTAHNTPAYADQPARRGPSFRKVVGAGVDAIGSVFDVDAMTLAALAIRGMHRGNARAS